MAVQDEERQFITEILSRLHPRHAQILELRYGLNGDKPHTLKEISQKISSETGPGHITKERARQLEDTALKRFKSQFRSLLEQRRRPLRLEEYAEDKAVEATNPVNISGSEIAIPDTAQEISEKAAKMPSVGTSRTNGSLIKKPAISLPEPRKLNNEEHEALSWLKSLIKRGRRLQPEEHEMLEELEKVRVDSLRR